MSEQDRIRLAEAMGWRLQKVEDAPLFGLAVGTQRWVNPAGSICIDVVDLPFNPFSSADDDYAVLEWMRKKYSNLRVTMENHHIYNGFCRELRQKDANAYRIGDYARAALKVLDND